MTHGTLLALYGHPDDETFGTGGTLARYAATGYRVVLVTATRGEAGELSDPSLGPLSQIGELRERELRCACDVLGVSRLYFLDYRDSGMAGTPDNENPLAFCRADLTEAVGRTVRIVRAERPQVILTFEPEGGYGHPDHIMANQVATAAFHAAGDLGQYAEHVAEGLQPWAPSRLYYTALPRKMFRAAAEALRAMGQDLSWLEGMDLENRGMKDEVISTEIDVAPYYDTKMAAFQCHKSQLSDDSIFRHIPEEIMRRFMSAEYYWRAAPEWREGEAMERDLFGGNDQHKDTKAQRH